MAKTIAQAKANYLRKVSVMPANYLTGVSHFLGVQVSPTAGPVQNYNANIGPESANKWERNLRNAFTV